MIAEMCYKKIKQLFLVSFFIIVMLFAMVSCYPPKAVVDPDSKTPGFKLFTGTSRGFRISFEYPNNWQRTAVEGGGGGRSYMPLFLPDSYITISSDINKSKGGNEDASDSIQFELNIISKYTGYQLISRNNIMLGQASGEEVISSYPFEGQDNLLPPAYTNVGEIVIERVLGVDYKGYLYYTRLLANLKAYDNEKTGFEHMLSTFRFLN
jgi:hypothetical protein